GSGLLLSSTDPNKADLGLKILIGGLVIQVISTALFFTLAVVIGRRASAVAGSWHRVMYILQIGSLLILTRSIYRVIEFSGGFDSSIARQESLLYVLDVLLMFIAVLAFAIVHPSVFLKANIVDSGTAESGISRREILPMKEDNSTW
ncbi:hypothetical protein HDU93_004075, partial [Gonapodya sp. JEL0774]